MLQEEEKHIEEGEDQQPSDLLPEPEAKKEWRLRINYRLITQNRTYILFLSVLAVIYIANNHLAEKKIRKINRLGKEIKELKWEYLYLKSELMFNSKMSEVSKAVEPLGLKEMSTPPQRIVVKGEKE